MPFSRSRSPESSTRSTRAARSPNAPEARSMASTRVVLPWSTCATMAMLRRRGRAPRVAGDGSAGAARVEVLTSQGSPSRGPSIPGGNNPRAVAVPIRPLTGPDDPRRRRWGGQSHPPSPARASHCRAAPTATWRLSAPPGYRRTPAPHGIAPNVGPHAPPTVPQPHHPTAAPPSTPRARPAPRSARRLGALTHALREAAPPRTAARPRRTALPPCGAGRPPHGRGVSGRPRRGRDGQRRGRTTAPGVIRPCRGRPRRGPRVGRSRRARRVVGRRGRAR